VLFNTSRVLSLRNYGGVLLFPPTGAIPRVTPIYCTSEWRASGIHDMKSKPTTLNQTQNRESILTTLKQGHNSQSNPITN
jgi:hypothetical protein